MLFYFQVLPFRVALHCLDVDHVAAWRLGNSYYIRSHGWQQKLCNCKLTDADADGLECYTQVLLLDIQDYNSMTDTGEICATVCESYLKQQWR